METRRASVAWARSAHARTRWRRSRATASRRAWCARRKRRCSARAARSKATKDRRRILLSGSSRRRCARRASAGGRTWTDAAPSRQERRERTCRRWLGQRSSRLIRRSIRILTGVPSAFAASSGGSAYGKAASPAISLRCHRFRKRSFAEFTGRARPTAGALCVPPACGFHAATLRLRWRVL